MSDETEQLLRDLDKLSLDQVKRLLVDSIEKLREMRGLVRDTEKPQASTESRCARLRELQILFSQPNHFRTGDLVQWKPGLRNKLKPKNGEPGVIIHVYEDPIYDPAEKLSGSPHFHEPFDIVLGILDEDDDLCFYHYDSRRFMPFSGDDGKGNAQP